MKKLLFTLFFCSALLCFAETEGKDVRVVSLSPNMTETIFALGMEKCLVGRSNACDYPEAAKKIPVAGRFGIPDIERVIALKPDYIVSSSFQDKAMVDRLKQFGIKVVFLPGDSFDDYFRNLKVLGDILNCPKKAEKLSRSYKAELEKFKRETEKTPEKERPKVLFVIWDLPLMTIGKKSFITDMIELAGGKSITASYSKAYFNCSLEWVLTHPPDLLVLCKIPERRAEELLERPGWEKLEAVKNKRFYSVDTDLVCRMGPRSLDGVRVLQKIFKKVKTNLKP
jgi:iron complex transport system substrate-binding protein